MIFLTTKGDILPCERISHQNKLGIVDQQGVNLDFDKIANRFNNYFIKIQETCDKCVYQSKCSQCILQTDIMNNNFNCEKFTTYSENNIADFFSKHIMEIEENPNLYLLTTKSKFI
jgi:uncharacterized protein